jgi:mRNA interferase MazF
MNRGDVRYYVFKAPDKKRPVLVLTRDSIIPYLGEITVATITSTIRDIPSEVRLTQEDGMPHVCAVNLDHVQTVAKDKLGKLITSLSSTRMQHVKAALLFALGFDS